MNHHVLLVDDDDDTLEVLKLSLRKEPYDVAAATSAQAALMHVKKHSVDVVVTDQQMPGMTGTELLRLLREQHPEIIGIMLTANANLDVAIKAINEGEITRFFTKPTSGIELTAAIREALQQKQLIAQSRKLVDAMRLQSRYIEQLEAQNPGITSVDRTSSGAVSINPVQDLETILIEVTEALDHAEKRMGRRKR